MTAPGVYTPEQVREHVAKVAATDGIRADDAEKVEVMARAMEDAGNNYIDSQTESVHGIWLGWADVPMNVFATAALEALRGMGE